MIGNPSGAVFEEAVFKWIENAEKQERHWGCFKTSFSMTLHSQMNIALVDNEIVAFDKIANSVFTYF